MDEARPPRPEVTRRAVEIAAARGRLPGDLRVPDPAGGVTIFAHGSGSSRASPRNVEVADALNRRGIATLLFDLLTEAEARDRANVFDVPLLADRLTAAVRWAREDAALRSLPICLFGASTGAAAALWAAAGLGEGVRAVVSRGGRPDLAAERLADVRAPTLLIVGERDPKVLRLNRWAASRLGCPHELAIVAGATHLFEEPGALKRVAELAGDWLSGLERPGLAWDDRR